MAGRATPGRGVGTDSRTAQGREPRGGAQGACRAESRRGKVRAESLEGLSRDREAVWSEHRRTGEMGEASAQGGAGTRSGTWAALAALSRMSKQPFCPPRDRPGWGASIRVEGGHPVQRDVTGRGLRAGRRRGAGAGWSPWGTHPKGSPKLRLATQTEVTASATLASSPSSLRVTSLLNGSG